MLHIDITEIGPGFKAKLAAFGINRGSKSRLEALEKYLAGGPVNSLDRHHVSFDPIWSVQDGR